MAGRRGTKRKFHCPHHNKPISREATDSVLLRIRALAEQHSESTALDLSSALPVHCDHCRTDHRFDELLEVTEEKRRAQRRK